MSNRKKARSEAAKKADMDIEFGLYLVAMIVELNLSAERIYNAKIDAGAEGVRAGKIEVQLFDPDEEESYFVWTLFDESGNKVESVTKAFQDACVEAWAEYEGGTNPSRGLRHSLPPGAKRFN